jgi:hypothetical protein
MPIYFNKDKSSLRRDNNNFFVRADTPTDTPTPTPTFTPTPTPTAQAIVSGGTVTTPGDGYTYRTFTSNGTLGVTGASLICDVLVVGGGGQCDHWYYNSGGGGGGVLYQTNQTITAGSYSINVGNGGIANGGAAAQSSSFAGRVATGGGRSGAGPNGYGGGTGGASGIPTSTSASVGNSGGTGAVNGDDSSGGGGGGSGGVGVNGATYGGAGGAGLTVFGVVYGKGGNGGWDGNGGSVSANRGAGANHGQNNGGSGVIIVRYWSDPTVTPTPTPTPTGTPTPTATAAPVIQITPTNFTASGPYGDQYVLLGTAAKEVAAADWRITGTTSWGDSYSNLAPYQTRLENGVLFSRFRKTQWDHRYPASLQLYHAPSDPNSQILLLLGNPGSPGNFTSSWTVQGYVGGFVKYEATFNWNFYVEPGD